MAAAVPDPDLPFDEGVNCGIGEVAGLFFNVEECRRQSGLFYRMVCRENLTIDVDPDRFSVKNKEIELSVHKDKILLETPTSNIDVQESLITVKVGDSVIRVDSEGVTISSESVSIDSPSIYLSGDSVTILSESVSIDSPSVYMSGDLTVSGTVTDGG